MRVEIVNDIEGRTPAMVFPPGENYVNLRENPHEIERIAPAREYPPLRTFLTAVNGPESLFASASISTKCDLPAAVSIGDPSEFAFQANLVFADLPLNFERDRYINLASSMKALLERDPGDAVRVVLRIAPCEFTAEKRAGFYLGIRMVAQGMSVEQAEMRWGLGLGRVQQALLFRARALKQEGGE